jgi:hypothetical protein
MNTATKGQQAYSRMLFRLGAIDLAQEVVITGAAPLSDKLCSTSSYHVTTAYW